MSEQANRYPLPPSPAALTAQLSCMRGAGCPLGVDVEAMAHAAARGDHALAHRAVRAVNPLASTCGHGCHAPCETRCRRRYAGAPVAIAELEAWASGFALPALAASTGPCTSVHDARSVAGVTARTPAEALAAPRSGHRIAIVGGGAAGLSCAHDLALLGHSSVIFDEALEPGGVLTRLLPPFRFAVAAARAEAAFILGMHAELRAGTRVEGRGALQALRDAGFAAVFVAVGAWAPREEPLGYLRGTPRVHDAVDVLLRRISMEGRIVVMGEGDLAVDAARHLARRSTEGVDLVHIAHANDAAAALPWQADAARDGVRLHEGWTAARARHGEDGSPAAVVLARDDQRRQLVLHCDYIVLAGHRAAGPHLADVGLRLGEDGLVVVDPITLATDQPGVWAGGACAFGHRSIAHAVADGKRAAWHIHAALTSARVAVRLYSAWTEEDAIDVPLVPPPPAATRARLALPVLALPLPAASLPAASVLAPSLPAASVLAPSVLAPPVLAPPEDPFSPDVLPLPAVAARAGAACYGCSSLPVAGDRCTGCGACVPRCPSGALSLSAAGDASRVAVDQDRCTRCGICIEACPENALAMLRAVWDERLSVVAREPAQHEHALLTAASARESPAATGVPDERGLDLPGATGALATTQA